MPFFSLPRSDKLFGVGSPANSASLHGDADAVLAFKSGVLGAKGYSHRRIEPRTAMKLACASSSLHRDIERGELTQLEFLDLCARELACDGVVLDVRHFPRNDNDYLAQVKKMATDRGLTIAALADPVFFSATQSSMSEVLAQAAALGAPLVAAPLARETEFSWAEQLARLGIATGLAKARNVTLALRNAAASFAATTHDCKRVAKEADSAWLRFGPDPARFDTASDARVLASNTVLLWSDFTCESKDCSDMLDAFDGFRGHLVIDDTSGAAPVPELRDTVARWRRAILNRR